MKRYFITGTDTDSGKTYVTCRLLMHLQDHHQRAAAIKPVASGCVYQDGQWVSEDALHLQRHNHASVTQNICPWRFQSPISPHLAAKEEGKWVSAQAVSAFCHEPAFSNLDYLLVEGAGGLMSPLNAHETWLDVLSEAPMPVILVVGMRLGCLNHALLTDVALKVHQQDCIGWIANCLDQDMLALSGNIMTLSEKMSAPLLAVISYGGNISENTLLL
jgi:dethiobiotin synthetase